VASNNAVRERLAAVNWHLHNITACDNSGFLNCCDDLLRGGTAYADCALTVANNDDCAEAELLATLDNFGNTSDLDNLFLELLVTRATATVICCCSDRKTGDPATGNRTFQRKSQCLSTQRL